jgi:hypothetical protein
LLILNPSLKKEGLHAVVRKKGFIFVLSPKVVAGDESQISRVSVMHLVMQLLVH